MTASEMKQEFLISYDKVTNFSAPGYTDYEISVFLTKAQERFLKQRYNWKTDRQRDGFEGSQKRRVDLSELVVSSIDSNGVNKTALSANQNGVHQNGYFFDLPSDCLYIVHEEAKLASSNTCINNSIESVTPVTHDEYSANIGNPFKKPDVETIWRLDISRQTANTNPKRVELITDGTYTISDYIIRYIKKPNPIIVDAISPDTIEGISVQTQCELDESVHREIIDIAVYIATETTASERVNLKAADLNITE